jgi:hypothetical protein
MYEGYEVPIALGSLGLQTDAAQSQLPPNAAILANNVAFWTGVVSKSNGSSRYNSSSLGAHIIAGVDYWPTASQQRMVTSTADGKLWKDTGDGTFSSGVPILVNETQLIQWSAVPDAGTFVFTWNGHNATSACNWNDTLSSMQNKLRTVTGLGAATLYAVLGSGAAMGGYDGFLYGMTVVMPGTSSSQPLISITSNTLTKTAVAVSYITTKLQSGATNLGTLDPGTHFITGGNEVPNNTRRLFIYTNGVSQLAMMTGDSAAVSAINRPSPDWSTTYPTFGLIYQGRHVAVLQHTIYISKLADHTDFTTSATDGTGASQFPIFPGEGDGIIGATVYKGALLLFKKPYGMYMFQWNGGDLATVGNVSLSKISDNFALSSPHAVQQIINDLVGGSSSGSLFSQNATNAFGALEAGDVLVRAQVRNYFRQNFDYAGNPPMHSAYYAEKFLAMFTGRDVGSNPQNRILMYDAGGASPRISVETKDQPTCMWTRKDTNTVPRPYYGANDGYVYAMDQGTWNVNGAAYTGEFQTPYIDMSFADPKLADKAKLFDFISVTYQPIGNWSFFIDVFIDGKFVQTVEFAMKQSAAALDSFVLDKDSLGGARTALVLRQPLKSCTGKAISFRIYNSQLNQSFTIERLTVSFRASGEQNRSSV